MDLFTEVLKQIRRVLVGGAVRDEVLGIEPKDRDWLVLDRTEAEMEGLGFIRVGKTIPAPVFLHPNDPEREEHAIPRKEVSTGDGYNDFAYDTESVSLIEDLRRRDFTINAMAKMPDGTIYDPFGGLKDIRIQSLRFTNLGAFQEDPLRVLRTARFASRLGFVPSLELIGLCRSMQNKLKALPKERVYAETKKAIVEAELPSMYFRWLYEFGALKELFPELWTMTGIPQPEEHHGEGDAFEHTMSVLNQARKATEDPSVLFAALYHDVGKIFTKKEDYPSHHGHEMVGGCVWNTISDGMGMDGRTRQVCAIAMRHHMRFHRALEMRAGSLVNMLLDLKVQHRSDLLEVLLVVGEADALGRIPPDHSGKRKADFLLAAADILKAIKMEPSDRPLENRLQILTQRRVNAIKQLRKQYD